MAGEELLIEAFTFHAVIFPCVSEAKRNDVEHESVSQSVDVKVSFPSDSDQNNGVTSASVDEDNRVDRPSVIERCAPT